MSELDPWYQARWHMVSALEDDLLGDDDEELTEPPLDRFIVGVLHPLSAEPVEDAAAVPEEGDSNGVDAEVDPGVSFSRARYPSSMGLSFAVDPLDTRTITVRAGATRYEPEGTGEEIWSPRPSSQEWRDVEVSTSGSRNFSVADGLELRLLIRPARGGVVNITAALVNVAVRPDKQRADHLSWFRPYIHVTANQGAFIEGALRRTERAEAQRSEDERSGDLLYREVKTLASGHGCAVDWSMHAPVSELRTTFLPTQPVSSSRAERDDVPALVMRDLADSSDLAALRSLVSAYRSWTAEEEKRLPLLEDALESIARTHLEAAGDAAHRIEKGIALLESDPHAARAFRVMNAVMHEQRARQDMIRASEQSPSSKAQMWRPFQLAFILLTLGGLVDSQDPERDIADVLWFPTGGGKTEAYLGLIAFIVVLRRLRDPDAGGGVAVIMRYTLRLLTVQQFERASSLICALELWRRCDLPSSASISIGLWVGQATTPNDVAAARRMLNGQDQGEGTPRQLLRCPWCGTDLPASAYRANAPAERLTVECPNRACDFDSGLPVYLVDTEVYREQPSLVIGTVDKFALLPWRAETGRLFGRGSNVTPPDLVIQDELHLISGPLGTLVGLYETAVDALATGVARPKLIASTATIRRAADQIGKVFDRRSAQFPPPGIDANDSFFSVQAGPEEKADRLYVGVMAPSASHTTLMVRTYAALLQAANTLPDDDRVRDAYWTLLGYFNSLRVLGSAFMQTVDDVPDRIRVVAARSGGSAREINPPRELTSRKRSAEIPEELDALGTSLPDPASPDVVLATNMISVGVDIDRLALMAVMGQPQTTSEYIQATSRVGRRFPGLVVTIFNATRSRDISHYERFAVYHRALYRHVEATGATPFAARALDRGLHGVLATLVRHLIAGAADDKAVEAVLKDAAGRRRVEEVILGRVERVEAESRDEVARAIANLFDYWRTSVDLGITKKYVDWRNDPKALLVPAGGDQQKSHDDDAPMHFPVQEPAWPTLTSLRNVDAESTLFLASKRRRNDGND